MRCSRTGRKMNKLLQQLNPARAFNGLWRNGDFVRLWSSLTITHFGGQITFLALPLTGALLLDATPLEMGVLTALEALPFTLFGLFAGVLVDRAPKLPIIVWSDIARAQRGRGDSRRPVRDLAQRRAARPRLGHRGVADFPARVARDRRAVRGARSRLQRRPRRRAVDARRNRLARRRDRHREPQPAPGLRSHHAGRLAGNRSRLAAARWRVERRAHRLGIVRPRAVRA